MTVLAGLAGGTVIAGLVLLALELTRHVQHPGARPRRRMTVETSARRQLRFAMAACAGVLAATRWPVAAIAALLAVLYVPRVISSRAAQRHAATLEALEQWTRRLSDMLTAGRSLEEALEASARYAPAAIQGEVASLGRDLASRTGTEPSLRAFAAAIDDPACDRIAAALIIATGRRGGGVRDVLNVLAGMVARDVAARRDIEADRAQHRTTVKWLTLFVLGFTVIAMVNRSYSAPFGTTTGQVVMGLVVTVYAGGLGWLHHLGSLRAQGRFLGAEATGRILMSPSQEVRDSRPLRATLRRRPW